MMACVKAVILVAAQSPNLGDAALLADPLHAVSGEVQLSSMAAHILGWQSQERS